VKEESSSFLKKKAAPALREPKNFCLLGARLRPERGRKSFLLLFFKKEDLSIACLPSPDCPEHSQRQHLQCMQSGLDHPLSTAGRCCMQQNDCPGAGLRTGMLEGLA
jgi:hypothetical protein